MNIHIQPQTTGMPYLLKDKQCIQQMTRPRMGKKTQAGVQHLFYQLFIIMLAPLPPKSQIPHPVRYYFPRCGCSFPSCPGHCMTVHSFARSKLPRQNKMNDFRLYSHVLVLGNSMCIDKRQSIQLWPPHDVPWCYAISHYGRWYHVMCHDVTWCYAISHYVRWYHVMCHDFMIMIANANTNNDCLFRLHHDVYFIKN